MSNQRPLESCCGDCGAHYARISEDGLCHACFVARGLRTVVQIQHSASMEPSREPMTGQRLAAILASASLRMSESDRLMLWIECHQLFGCNLDRDRCSELVRVVEALNTPVSHKTLASQWN